MIQLEEEHRKGRAVHQQGLDVEPLHDSHMHGFLSLSRCVRDLPHQIMLHARIIMAHVYNVSTRTCLTSSSSWPQAQSPRLSEMHCR